MLEIHFFFVPYEVLRDVNITAPVDLFHVGMWPMNNMYVLHLKGSGQVKGHFFFFFRRNKEPMKA